MVRRGFLLTFLLLLALCHASRAETVDATINGLEISLDSESGGLVKLSFAGVGNLLEAKPDRAGMLDLAYPIEKFEPLRLAARFSKGAKIAKDESGVTITWDRLGASRAFPLEGSVSGMVRLRGAPDGRSIVLTATITNHSPRSVRQVVFPDLAGLRPFAGADATLFRSGGVVSAPFIELAATEEKISQQYMVDPSAFAVNYQAGGLFHPMVIRWMDFGGLSGGLSLFPRRWGWDKQVVTRLQLSELEQSLCLMCLHEAEIKTGETWESGEFWLTPHTSGWAKGIEPYRAWVKQNFKREYPIPRHVREGLGYRTAWMCQNQPDDPQDAVFTFKDLPKLATECREHGIDELALWSWHRGFVLPFPPPYPHLGTEQDMIDAVAACKKLGVNVAPFVSVAQANKETAPRYGLKVTDNNGWTYHTELVPRWNPPYATGFACVGIPRDNPLWQKDVLESITHLVNNGITSLGWDQYFVDEKTPNLQTLTSQFRAVAKAKDPESTLMGEDVWNIEIDCAHLDYTWDWGTYRDVRPVTSVLAAPRINCIITASAANVKKAFADNIYMNLFPRKAESINGSDYLSNWPEMSRAVKQCAALRKQFLHYFTDGTLIGDCILTKPVANVHVSAYVLSDRILTIAINEGAETALQLQADALPWLGAGKSELTLKTFDGQGKLISTERVGGKWQSAASPVKTGEIVVYEITTQ